jgi:hypothetical protein
MAGYAVAHLDEIEEFADAGCRYRPIRHHLGITAFGVTVWDDSDLDPIRHEPAFQQLISAVRPGR